MKKFTFTPLYFSLVLGLILVSNMTIAQPTAVLTSSTSPPTTKKHYATVSGTVMDDQGIPVIGATVYLKDNSGVGTTTDLDGKFSLDVPNAQGTLVISFVGYKTQEVAIGGRTDLSITLMEDAEQLDEVIVVGYGIQKKRDVTGAISTLDNEKIEGLPVVSGVQAMQGQVAGVDVQSTGGRPGQAPTIKIRGRRSISAGNDPLYVYRWYSSNQWIRSDQ